MPIYAVVNANNVVFNRIVADSLDIAQEGAAGFICVPCDGKSAIGDTWDGENFIKPEPFVIEAEVVEEPTVTE